MAGAGAAASRSRTVVVVGCGLIGGSIGLALRAGNRAPRVVGIDRPKVLDIARSRGAIDAAASSRQLAAVVGELGRSDTVVLAVPIDVSLRLMPLLAGAVDGHDGPLILDVGSVKTGVVRAAAELGLPHFVGGHPMAGRESGGIENASGDLLTGRPFVLCPPTNATRTDKLAARRFVRGIGGRPVELEAELHDATVAVISHLPHLAAYTLMDIGEQFARRIVRRSGKQPGQSLPWTLAAGSWRDVTRVAAADPRLWDGIIAHNADAVADTLDLWINALIEVRDGLRRGRTDVLLGDRPLLDGRRIARLRRRIANLLP